MFRSLENYDKGRYKALNPLGFPDMLPVTEKIDCNKWVDFDNCINLRDTSNTGVNFYIDDYKFERIWNAPERYVDLFSRFGYVVQPDFSLYYDFPKSLQIYNKYRNHWLSAFYGERSKKIFIPNIRVSTPDNYYWAFMGYPKNSVVAFSDIGCSHEKTEREMLHLSYSEMIKRLEPIQILYFTRSPKSAPSESTVISVNYIKRW